MALAWWAGTAALSWAAGSGLNVVVVVNQNSTNSIQLGNYYCERRQVPPLNVLRINWTGGNVQWSRAEFESVLLTPLLAMLAARQLTNQIDYVALSMDMPYRVTDSNGVNSTTAALFYGFQADGGVTPPNAPASCSLPSNSSSAYAGSEDLFRNLAPGNGSASFLATLMTADTLVQAMHLVDQGVASDGVFPTQTVVLAKTSDFARNVRYTSFDNAVFNTRLRGNYSLQRANSDSLSGQTNLLGCQTGLATFNVASNAFVAGALADSLTSYGGYLFEASGQTSLLAFTQAGAAGSYGTVVEPCNYLEKFPDPQNHFFQARGFTLAECYYQSLTNPYQGLIVGEPLAAPFRQSAAGVWIGVPANALLRGTTNLSAQFAAGDASHPLQQVDLFLDGVKLRTLTNIAPRRFNTVNVTLNGRSMNYTVPNNATIKTVAGGVADMLNSFLNQNSTSVQAVLHGDRVELQSFDPNRPGAQISLSVSSAQGSAAALTTFIAAGRPSFLDTLAYGLRQFAITGTPLPGSFLELVATKTNGATVTVSVTNNSVTATAVDFAQQLLNLINATPALQSADGLVAEDLTTSIGGGAEFHLRARSPGWGAAQIQADLNSSPTLILTPATNVQLDENLGNLQPRNHLYLTAGAANLTVTFPFDTTALADGFHELTAVASEGSHVRTQTRVTQTVHIQNTPVSATFTLLDAGASAAVDTVFHFAVAANTNPVSKIELFSTGGLLASVLNQSTGAFTVNGPDLGIGLHPFYALVTTTGGQIYRTETILVRLAASETPFVVSISGPSPLKLFWPAAAGRSYEVLTSAAITGSFSVYDTVTAVVSGVYEWIENAPDSSQRFYRVRVTP